MAELFLINEESGLGADFEVLDVIRRKGKKYVVLIPASMVDQQIAEALMEKPQAAESGKNGSGAEEGETNCIDVCILEVGKDRNGRCTYLRVEEQTLQKVFALFREKNAGRFRFW